MKPEPRRENILPITDAQLARLDELIEWLMEVRDILDGDTDREGFLNDGDPSFPGDPLDANLGFYRCDQGPGDPEDGEEGEADEDSDADEPSHIWVTTRSGRERMA